MRGPTATKEELIREMTERFVKLKIKKPVYT
jgi:hypothetical protein